jgi:PAS domain S-box-containing protein
MSLRHILLVLSLLAFLSASAGGVLYYTALHQSALKEAERQAVANTELIKSSLNRMLTENRKTVVTLAGMPALRDALMSDDTDALYRANMILDHFAATLKADVCYLMNRDGLTIASSNRAADDSFVGCNFAFRPYFRRALRGKYGIYMAVGTTSGKRGIYNSYPVYGAHGGPPIGVAVIKSSIAEAGKALGLSEGDLVLITDPHGIIFIANRPQWLYQLAWKLPSEEITRIDVDRQFGAGPRSWVGLTKLSQHQVLDRQGNRYLMHQAELRLFPGWKIIHLRSMRAIARSVSGPLLRVAGPAAAMIALMVGLSVLVLFRKASREIQARLRAEEALRQSENRYRSLYHHTPAMLHSIDPQGRLVSISDYWAETLGYTRSEAIGRPLTDFLAPDSREMAEKEVFPFFFKTGMCNDVPYTFIKKNGEIIEAMMSAIADRDAQGRILRSLAVSIDVTARNRAEENLRLAKEELSRYSKELEREVRIRSGEISAILKYTPNAVYIKDTQGRYLMVNARFEALFGVENEAVRGKTDADLLPAEVAAQFQEHDAGVLKGGPSLKVEERIEQEDGPHTYLAVKFPIYEETGHIRGICGISTDITALKKAQEQLRCLSGSIIANQEKERAAIARELHDELGQLLTALRMDAVWLQERLKKRDDNTAARAAAMCGLIDTTIEEVRGMAIRLRPGVLDDLGLVDALEWFTTEYERRAQIPCIFTQRNIPVVDNAIATAAYRIAQEALTNAARHAEAARTEITLEMDGEGALVLKVVDDGRGFDPECLTENGMLGLAGMRERAALVGGSLAVQSQPGRGTVVSFRVPLHPNSGRSN